MKKKGKFKIVTGLIVLLSLLSQVAKAYELSNPNLYKVVNIQGHLNIRKGPDENYPVAGKAKSGDTFYIADIKGNGRNKWALVLDSWEDGYESWLSMKYLKEISGIDISKEHYVFTEEQTSNLNVRRGPGRNQTILMSLPKGTSGINVLKTVKKNDGWWANVRWRGSTGWVHTNFLIPIRLYTVKSGDTLYRITKNETIDGDVEIIKKMNNLSSPYALKIGQKIKVPYYP